MRKGEVTRPLSTRTQPHCHDLYQTYPIGLLISEELRSTNTVTSHGLTHYYVSTHISMIHFPLRSPLANSSQDTRHTLRFVNSCPTGLKIHLAPAYIPDSNSVRMVSRVCLLSDTYLIYDPWSRLGSKLNSEQDFAEWYISEDVFSKTWDHLGRFDKIL
jgi:hypothetical protein